VDATVLYRLMRGTLVEIDTEVMPGYQAELVKHVRGEFDAVTRSLRVRMRRHW
jgi:hypothetical protein